MNTNTTTTTANINGVAVTDLAAIFERYNGMSANDAMRVATLNIELEKALANGVARFTFRKKDGTIREALGTTKTGVVGNFYVFKGDTRAKSAKVHAFFDLNKGEWRCYTKANLLTFTAAA